MKTIRNIVSIAVLFSSLFLFSCSEDWDNHYDINKGQGVENENLTIVNATLLEYLDTETSLSTMLNLFKSTGNYEALQEKDQLFTLLVVNNENYSTATPSLDYLAKTHIANVSLSPSNLKNNQRVLMWHGKYLNVGKEENEEGEMEISFNGQKVSKVIKLNNGYIYELEALVEAPQSMYEFIENLGDEYSIFKDMVLSKSDSIFDKANSEIVGVDNTGSTVYDSVFIVTNTYFANMGIDLTSESINATLLLPSNEVATKAINEAKQKLVDWDLLFNEQLQARADTIIEVWILQAAFYNKRYSAEDFEANEDLTSVFKRQWRTTVQEVDLANPVELSNGVAYMIENMKIPTNVLIYRLKDKMEWHEFMTEEEKNYYFVPENLQPHGTPPYETKVTEWSGWPAGGFPMITNRIVKFSQIDAELPFRMDFIPNHCKEIESGKYDIKPYKVPPGEYDLCLGFMQKEGHDITVHFNGELVRTITTTEFTSTTFHYDRGGQGYPEGYDTSKATDKKKGNYDRDGGKVGVVTIEGDAPVEVTISFSGDNANGRAMNLHHWCLKPTKNCY